MRRIDITFLIYPNCQSIDVAGPFDVFSGANQWLREHRKPELYRVTIASSAALSVRTQGGLRIAADTSWARLRGKLHTLVVVGGQAVEQLASDANVCTQIQRLARRSRRVTSICTGSFLLAAAGMLDGKRATTHWAYCERLAKKFPKVQVDAEPIYVRDGAIWTSAGATAGIDLSLAIVEHDIGREAALSIARWMVLFLRRPGSQRQFSSQLAAQIAERDVLRDVQAHINDSLGADLNIEKLAARAHMSPRHFARCFRQEVGVTPARYVLTLRLESARRLLEETGRPIEHVAEHCGFGTSETMRRQFLRELHVNPREYRQRFQSLPLTARANHASADQALTVSR
jgi:transcriptional regulator GlxA family with amidase domain